MNNQLKRPSLSILWVGLLLITSAFTLKTTSAKNTDSWSVYLDEQVLLASWNKNKMGDFKSIEHKRYNKASSLKVNRFVCGNSNMESTSIITVKTSDEKTVLKTSKMEEGIGFKGEMSLNELFAAPLFEKDVPLKIYFTIKDQEGDIIQTYLIAQPQFNS